MADMQRIHEFAVKWLGKFRDPKAELADSSMAEDCAALGFAADCGNVLERLFGSAVSDSGKPDQAFDGITDASVLGSAVYFRWNEIHRLADTDAGTLAPKDRAWFIAALERMATLSGKEPDSECVVILFPEFAALKEEIQKLRTEMSMLLLERDELKYVECKNIEMQYMLALGSLEYKAYELDCEMLRLKRKMELIQAKKNRQESVSVSEIEALLDEEFAAYQEKLDEQIDKMNAALERNEGELLTAEEAKELKALYRAIVKALHPDIHPDASEAKIRLFQKAVEAYENGDLNTLRIIKEMVAESSFPEPGENGLTALKKEKGRMLKTLAAIKKQIKEIKEGYPYRLKPIVQSEKLTAERKADLEDIISALQEMIEEYKERLEEMLRCNDE